MTFRMIIAAASAVIGLSAAASAQTYNYTYGSSSTPSYGSTTYGSNSGTYYGNDVIILDPVPAPTQTQTYTYPAPTYNPAPTYTYPSTPSYNPAPTYTYPAPVYNPPQIVYPQPQPQPERQFPAIDISGSLQSYYSEIKQCLAATSLPDPIVTAVYKGRRGATRMRVEGTPNVAGMTRPKIEDCVVRRGGARLNPVDGTSRTVTGVGDYMFAPVNSRFRYFPDHAYTPVLDSAERVVGWLILDRDEVGGRRRLREPVRVN